MRSLLRQAIFILQRRTEGAGVKGNVMDAVREDHLEADVIFACGPAPMLRAIKAYGLERGIPCWILDGEKMACGVGACLACVSASRLRWMVIHMCTTKRICKDGPVFFKYGNWSCK